MESNNIKISLKGKNEDVYEELVRLVSKLNDIFPHLVRDYNIPFLKKILGKLPHKFVFDFILFVYILSKVKSKKDLVFICSYVVFRNLPYSKIFEIINRCPDKFNSHLQSEMQFDIESSRDFLSSVISCNLCNIVKDLFLSVFFENIFGQRLCKRVLGVFENKFGKDMSLMNFLVKLLEFSEEVCRISLDIRSGKSFVESIFSSDFYKFIQRTNDIVLNQHNTQYGETEFEVFKTDIRDDYLRLRSFILEGNEIDCKKAPWPFKKRLSTLRSMFNDYGVRLRSMTRKMPIGVVIHGSPGIGKSSLLTIVYKLWAKHKGRKFDRSMVYDRNPRSEHWTNHDPATQPIIHYPELGSLKKQIARIQGDKALNELLLVCDTQPYSAEMAGLEDKGKVMVMPDLVVVDTNNADMNVAEVSSNPTAIYRRFLYVDVKVREEFKKDGCDMLDPFKARASEDPRDLWNLRVSVREPKGDHEYNERVYMSGSIYKFSSFFLKYLEREEESYKQFEQAISYDVNDYLVSEAIFRRTWKESFRYHYYRFMLNIYLDMHYHPIVLRCCALLKDKDVHVLDMIHIYSWTFVTLSFVLILLRFLLVSAKMQSEMVFTSGCDRVCEHEDKSDVKVPETIVRKDNDVVYDSSYIYPRVNTNSSVLNNCDDIVRRIRRNLRYARFERGGKYTDTHVMGIYGNLFAMNKHFYHSDALVTISSKEKRLEGAVKYRLSHLKIYNSVDDLVFVEGPGLLFKDIRPYMFEKKSCFIGGQLFDLNGDPVYVMTSTFEHNKGNYTVHDSLRYKDPIRGSGRCGRPLICRFEKGHYFCGIHTGGKGEEGAATQVTLDMLPVFECHSEGDLNLLVESKLVSPHRKSVFRYEKCDNITVFGDISNKFAKKVVSSLSVSPMVEHIEELTGLSPYVNGELMYQPPLMKAIVRPEYVHPFNVWVRKISSLRKSLDHRLCSVVEDVILRRLGDFSLSPVSFDVAREGFAGNCYYRSMNMSTSAGVLWDGKKSKYELNLSSLRESVTDMIDSYHKGVLAHPILGAQLKDEPRLFTKVKSGKTRVFCMSSYPAIVVNRMYLLPFFALMQKERDLFCTKIGANMHSFEAHEMYKTLEKFKDTIFEGDYSGYDTHMPVQVGSSVNNIIYKFLKRSGYNSYSLKIVKGILSENLYPYILLQNTLFCAPGLQPSGRYGTAEDNSLRGLFLLVYFFVSELSVEGKGHYDPNDFFLFVKPYIYGDDVLCGVDPEISDKFNGVYYSRFVEEVYGMTFTSSSKEQIEKPFVEFADMSFLRRTFRYNECLKRYCAVLSPESFVKSLTLVMHSKDLTQDSVLVESFVSFSLEKFFYFDKKSDYDGFIDKCIKYLSINTCYSKDHLKDKFFVFEDLVDKYKVRCKLRFGPLNENNGTSQCDHYYGLFCPKDHSESAWLSSGDLFRSTLVSSVPLINKVQKVLGNRFGVSWLEPKPKQGAAKNDESNEFRRIRKLKDPFIKDIIYDTMFSEMDDLRDIPKDTDRKDGVISDANKDVKGVARIARHEDDYVVVPDNLPDSGMMQREELNEFFARPVLVDSIQWDTTVQRGEIQVIRNWFDDPTIRAKLRNYAFFRGVFKIHIMYNASRFDSGFAVISNQPYARFNTNLRFIQSNFANLSGTLPRANYLSQSQEVRYLHLGQDRQQSMTIPFVLPKKSLRLFNDEDTEIGNLSVEEASDLSTLSLVSVVDRRNVGSITTNPVEIQIFVTCHDVELGQVTSTNLLAEGGVTGSKYWSEVDVRVSSFVDKIWPTKDEKRDVNADVSRQKVVNFQSEMDERDGPISGVATSVSKAADALSGVPFISGIARATSEISKKVAAVAKIFGFSKPVLMEPVQWFKNLSVGNTALTIFKDTAYQLAADPRQELSITTYSVDGKDEMAINTITSRQSLFDVAEVTDSDTVRVQRLFRYPVMPMNGTRFNTLSSGDRLQLTALAHCASAFTTWRGTISFRLVFVASAVCRGKIAVYYEPNGRNASAINSRPFDFNKQYYYVVDLEKERDIVFHIGYAKDRAFSRIRALNVASMNLATGAQYYSNSAIETDYALGLNIGFLSAVKLTNISPDDTVSIVAFTYSDDIQFAQPRDMTQETIIMRNQPSPPPPLLQSEMDIMDEHNDKYTAKSVLLNKVKTSFDDVYMEHYGEKIVSFRSLLKRDNLSFRIANNSDGDTDRLDVPIYPMPSLIDGDLNLPNISADDVVVFNQSVFASYNNLYNWLAPSYLFVRGGMRIRMWLRENPSSNISVTRKSRFNNKWPSRPNEGTVGDINMSNSGSVIFNLIESVPEVEVPFYSRDAFSLSTNQLNVSSPNDIPRTMLLERPVARFEPIPRFSFPNNRLYFSHAAAEDFMFFRFQGGNNLVVRDPT